MNRPPRDVFREFVDRLAGRRLAIAGAADAAGLAAIELARRWFAARGIDAAIITPGRCELLADGVLVRRVRESGADALLALDLGATDEAADLPMRPSSFAGDSGATLAPVLFIDLHRHEFHLPRVEVIEPATEGWPAGVVLWRILRDLAGDDPTEGRLVDSLAWLATIAAEASHAEVPWPARPSAERPFTRSDIREASVLLNSAGRSSEHPVAAAMRLLAGADGPQDILSSETPERAALGAARAEVMREVGKWAHTRPRFMWRVALVPVASPCRIEGILAAMWERQLGRYMIVVANSGCAPGKVMVAGRTTSADRNLLRLLDAVAEGDAGSSAAEPKLVALGCRRYVEAVVDVEHWKEMLKRMRFRRVKTLVPKPKQPTLF